MFIALVTISLLIDITHQVSYFPSHWWVSAFTSPNIIVHTSSPYFKVVTTRTNQSRRRMIRAPTIHDLPDMKRIIDAAELFPSEMMDEMTKKYFDQQQQQHENDDGVAKDLSNEFWFVKVVTQESEDSSTKKHVIAALVYAAPEKMTEGCYNVLLLAVHPQYHRMGYGRALMSYMEDQLKMNHAERVVLVETSGNEEYGTARTFYTALGYNAVARIPEFYQKGEDKIIFHKFLL